MNPVVSGQVREYAKQNSLSGIDASTEFELYSIYSIMRGFLSLNVDEQEAHLAGSEFGIDGIGILIQGELVTNAQEAAEKMKAISSPTIEFVFLQSKTSIKLDYGDISKFFDGIAMFIEGKLNHQSLQIAELHKTMMELYEIGFKSRNPSLRAFYITTGINDIAPVIKDLVQKFIKGLKDKCMFDDSGIDMRFVGASDLQKWFRSANSAIESKFVFEKAQSLPANEKVKEAHIGYVSARELLKLCALYDNEDKVVGINRAVFFDNVRDYNPDSDLNKKIKQEILCNGGGDFIFRNNGVTIVARSSFRTSDTFKISDYQIVNGCQTTSILYDLIYGNKDNELSCESLLDEIKVPLRLVVSENDEFTSSIILGTNNQNPVKKDQFLSLKPFMKGLEQYCQSKPASEIIYFERRENQFRNREVEKVRIIQPIMMVKAVIAGVLLQPNKAARDYKQVIEEQEAKLFESDDNVFCFHAICFAHYRLDFMLRNNRVEKKQKAMKYYYITGISLIINGSQPPIGLKSPSLKRIAEMIVKICSNDDHLKIAIDFAHEVLEKMLTEKDSKSPEQTRDLIRSETFGAEFKENFAQNIPSELSAYRVNETKA